MLALGPAATRWPNPVLLAVELVLGGARVVIVGGAARWLLLGGRRPRDLDVLVTEQQVLGLVGALEGLGTSVAQARLLRSRDVALVTGWGRLDVFVRPDVPVVRLLPVARTTLAVADV